MRLNRASDHAAAPTCSRDLRRQQRQVKGEGPVHAMHGKAGTLDQFPAVALVEHVMMKTSVLDVLQGPNPEVFDVRDPGILREVVLLQYLRQVGQVVFAYAVLVVAEHVIDTGRLATMVEGIFVVRKHEDQRTGRAKDALPLHQGLNRVGEVFQIVRRQDEVVSAVSHRLQSRSIAEDAASGRFTPGEDVSVVLLGPYRGPSEVAVVERAQMVVEINRLP